MNEILKARVELKGYAEDGNYEVEKVEYYNEEKKDWDDPKEPTKLPKQFTIEKMGCINIHSVEITASPGRWVLFAGGYVWIP